MKSSLLLRSTPKSRMSVTRSMALYGVYIFLSLLLSVYVMILHLEILTPKSFLSHQLMKLSIARWSLTASSVVIPIAVIFLSLANFKPFLASSLVSEHLKRLEIARNQEWFPDPHRRELQRNTKLNIYYENINFENHSIISVAYINSNNPKIIEGESRCKQLDNHLNVLKLTKYVWLSGDAPGIIAKVEFDPKTNQMIGLVLPIDPNSGMLIPFSFLARNRVKSSVLVEKYAYWFIVD